MKKRNLTYLERLKEKTPHWLNIQNLTFFIVILAFIVIVIWSEPLSYLFSEQQPLNGNGIPTSEILPGTPTPLPEEWLRSAEQTNGIIIGAVIIFLTIIAGTTIFLVRDRD